ncbi:DUF2200 domain-containing protein [Exiguobacterium sp. Leaf196]|uniref:DUF2200 domain-containing protein n=1 Tax=Exiguobacterium sp. Leaf196 TaxID=1736298 RepID=UPI0006F6BA0D|nr:DUF2200 family protein [Exiguobacterium sp. Leaf196]KQS45438.1 hypothetical protein ASG02_05185 [Exiguobacterium sp. Leaf196]
MSYEKVFQMPMQQLYNVYLQKVERKQRTQEELDEVLFWLTGHSHSSLEQAKQTQTVAAFFEHAPDLNERRFLVTGVICGIRVENLTDPHIRNIRILDKLVDELAKGKALSKILR